jgi:hypothetical protein
MHAAFTAGHLTVTILTALTMSQLMQVEVIEAA